MEANKALQTQVVHLPPKVSWLRLYQVKISFLEKCPAKGSPVFLCDLSNVTTAQRMEGDRIYCLKGPSISHQPRQRCISIIYGGSDQSLENTSYPLKWAAGLGTPVSPSRWTEGSRSRTCYCLSLPLVFRAQTGILSLSQRLPWWLRR